MVSWERQGSGSQPAKQTSCSNRHQLEALLHAPNPHSLQPPAALGHLAGPPVLCAPSLAPSSSPHTLTLRCAVLCCVPLIFLLPKPPSTHTTALWHRFVKLDLQVDRTLTQNGVFVFTAIPAAPERTCTLFMRTEGEKGVWLACVGGNEGVYPAGQDPRELLDFAAQVCCFVRAVGCGACVLPGCRVCRSAGICTA